MILPDATLPDYIVTCANHALDALRKQCGKNILPDMAGADLLTLRARLMQFKPATQVSANGSCHLLLTQDRQWIALNLSRSSDWELLPALFRTTAPVNTWLNVATQVEKNPATDLLDQGRALGLAIAAAEKNHISPPENYFEIISRGKKCKDIRVNNKPIRVLDLSSLWAGPLCSQLLQQAGAQVVKVESKTRPDGAGLNTRSGGKEFYAWLNRNKELITLDFSEANDIQQLKQMIVEADIVIEGSRPRALRQLGIDAEAMVQQQPGLVWVSITGYGRCEPQANWIAFGDDAAISAGLSGVADNKPVFIGDAIADPLTGLHAALAAYENYQCGHSALIDLNLHTVSRYCR